VGSAVKVFRRARNQEKTFLKGRPRKKNTHLGGEGNIESLINIPAFEEEGLG